MKTVHLTLWATLLGSALAQAQVAPICDAPHAIDKYQLLRRLSLDLRDKVPDMSEYAALDAQADVPDALVQSYIQTDDFRRAMRRYHELMLWPNVNNVQLNNVNSQLTLSSQFTPGANTPAYHLASSGRAKAYRGVNGAPCGDWQQTHFVALPDGGTWFQPDPAFVQTQVLDSGYLPDGGAATAKDEGWRMVVPYWDPTATPIKVCAFDAQETPSGLGPKAVTYPCNDYRANGDPACGCGPNLQFCYGGNVQRVIETQLREQVDLSVDDVTTGGKPYTDLLLSSKAHENGPIAFWKQNLAPNLSFSNAMGIKDPAEELAAPNWSDLTFKEVDLDKGWTGEGPKHAGVVTLPAYLLRFQTDRGRANRLRIDFMCESFVPATVLTPQPGCDPSSPDLTQRCNCQYCHQNVEPLAAYFGLFSEAGTTVMTDKSIFPPVSPTCVNNGGSYCGRYYVTLPDAPNPGTFLPMQFITASAKTPAHPEYGTHMNAGPQLWAQGIIADGTFARCATQKVFSYFVKREMDIAGDASEELPLLQTLSTGFQQNGYSFPWLVQQVVSLPQYRRVR